MKKYASSKHVESFKAAHESFDWILGYGKSRLSSCCPMIGSRSLPIPMKLPSLIHTYCRISIVAIALALMNGEIAPRGASSSQREHSDRMVVHRRCVQKALKVNTSYFEWVFKWGNSHIWRGSRLPDGRLLNGWPFSSIENILTLHKRLGK